MLYYTEIELSHDLIIGETSIGIYISGCSNHCDSCHYPELQRTDFGFPLKDYFDQIISVYERQATCVAFLGEGDLRGSNHPEFAGFVREACRFHLKTALFSGRDILPEEWMKIFDYVKTGSYKSEFGSLTNPGTNQKLFRNIDGKFQEITKIYWGA